MVSKPNCLLFLLKMHLQFCEKRYIYIVFFKKFADPQIIFVVVQNNEINQRIEDWNRTMFFLRHLSPFILNKKLSLVP